MEIRIKALEIDKLFKTLNPHFGIKNSVNGFPKRYFKGRFSITAFLLALSLYQIYSI